MRYVCPECGDGDDAAGACPVDGTQRSPVGADALLGTTIGSWRVARLLGAGGMGRVYVAVQPQIGARVAIKVLKRESAADPDVVDRFFNEARAVNMIKHEAIVDVIDLGRLPDGAPYIVMEYLDGASLGAIVRREKRLALGTLSRIVSEVLAALGAAHAKAIIHRDLKPDNVFVSPSGRVTVLDFGVAKLAADAEGFGSTQTGSLLGTPAYMSPEQARSQPLDARSDLYAVGVMLYEAATGKLPFVAQNLFDLLQMHVAQAPRPPRELAPEIPDTFEAVILRALAKDPKDRFASAAEMRAALATAADGLPQLALSSVVIPAEPPGHEKKSDPFAETAASDSIATDKTQVASAPAKPAESKQPAQAKVEPNPLEQRQGEAPRSIQLTRGTLFALLAAAALLGLGGAALVMAFGKRDAPTGVVSPPANVAADVHDASVIVDSQPAVAATTIDKPVSRSVPEDAGGRSAVLTPVHDAGVAAVKYRPDAAAVSATTPADAAEVAATTPDAVASQWTMSKPKAGETKEETLERLLRSTEAIAMANPKAIDPLAEYKRAVARVVPLAGKAAFLTSMRIHAANAQGLVDVTSEDGSVEIYFASPSLAKVGEPCYFVFIYEEGVARFNRAEQGENDKCNNGVRPPACSLAEIIKRAEAKGMVIGKKGVTFNRFPRGWMVSSGDYGDHIDDDCE
ncbi:MAG TPA: protein kinase [Kofleriaceae bacterium]|nr:protein kinase [Kofleriaceae bacterium]